MTDEKNDLMSPPVNVARIMWTGTIWFAMETLAIVLFLGLLLSSGWRPTTLPVGLAVVWWAGCVILAASMALMAWSGCPVLEVDVPTASRNKSRTAQLGTLFLLIGGAATIFAVLLS